MTIKNFFWIAAVILSMTSCSKDDSYEEVLTEADLFVNSDSFRQLEKVLREDRKIMIQAYQSLSKNEKKKCLKLQELGKCKQGAERIEIAKDISTILNIDFDERARILSKAATDCYGKCNVDKTSLLRAIQKRNARTRSESDEHYREIQYQQCVNACESVYLIDYGWCYSHYVELVMNPDQNGGINYEYIYSDGYGDCIAKAYYDRIDCLMLCEYSYK